jgi:hypothetical protein
MIDSSQIREHMDVVGSDGEHVGVVDRLEGQRIKLTKSDAASGGQHHYIDMSLVESVEDGAVCLSKTAKETRQAWQ